MSDAPEERRRRIQAENAAAECKARESVEKHQERLARLEFERSSAARGDASRKMQEAIAKAGLERAELANVREGQPCRSGQAGSNSGVALFERGMSLLNGIGVAKDAFAGAALILEAAEMDVLGAAFVAGEIFLLGDGVETNVHQAFYWFSKAAAAGEVRADTALGLLCLYEFKDFIEAKRYLELAAKKGDADAARELKSLVTPSCVEENEVPQKRFWWDRTHELKSASKKIE
jgi:TPR repeat protein